VQVDWELRCVEALQVFVYNTSRQREINGETRRDGMFTSRNENVAWGFKLSGSL
jgi:hypothetical protein